jgi:acetyl-CoA synthetase
MPILPRVKDYDSLRRQFQWRVPSRYNIGVDVCDRWAEREPERLAILHARPDGRDVPITYGWLRDTSNRLANALRAHGISRGDRVSILLPQSPEVAASHIGIYKIGGIALPLAVLFGTDALSYRLQNSGAAALVTNKRGAERIAEIRKDLPALKVVLSLDGAGDGALDFSDVLARASSDFVPVDTSADDPAMMVYTSGTTGQPKGALHGHRVLIGHFPGVETHHDLFPQAGDRIWTPADWAWAGGLLNVLLPGLHYGVPVVAQRFEKFDPEEAFALMARTQVRNAFIPPTALRMMRAAPNPKGRHTINMRSIGSGGESLGAETYEWGKSAFGLVINEFYGQTECNIVLAACSALGVSKPGAIGRPVAGHSVAIIDADGNPLKAGETGQIAVKRPDPVMFLEYWGKPEATRDKFIGEWMTTGDQGVMDEDGYVSITGRLKEIINRGGEKISPREVDEIIMGHPAVHQCVTFAMPHDMLGEDVAAAVVLRQGISATDKDLREYASARLAPYKVPKKILILTEIPVGATGKLQRIGLAQKLGLA